MTVPHPVLVRDLRKSYGRLPAVNGISFDVRRGEVFGLMGPNGAGKTTTVECVIGLLEPDSGTIEIGGIDRRTRPAEVRQQIGAALQTTALQDAITPREALTLFGALYPVRTEPSVLLERFGLVEKADAPFATLSGGQRQRLALALAFVNRPEVVFLDEPTAGLDPQSRRDLHREIAAMSHDGHTVLLTTHYLDEAEAICDRVAIIAAGRIVAAGTPQELVASSHAAAPTVSLTATPPIDRARLGSVPGVTGLAVNGPHATFQTATLNRTLAALGVMLEAEGAELTSLHVRKATLEDVFIELTRVEEGG